MLDELHRVARLGLHFQQLFDPLAGALLGGAAAGLTGFVSPVSGDPGFGDTVHVFGADLHFQRRMIGAEQDRVQRLIAIGLG